MRTLTAAFVALIAFLPLAVAAVGGDACQVAQSAVPTPGLSELVFGSKEHKVPDDAHLSHAQIEALARQDTKIRRTLSEIEAQIAKLPAGRGVGANAELADQALPELVAHFLANASRENAILIDIESASEFRLANEEAVKAKQAGDKSRWCPLCHAVRRGIEAKFAWKAGEFGKLTDAQEKEAAVLASKREDLRRTWADAVKAELTAPQLAWLRKAQMSWVQQTLRSSVTSGMRSLGQKKCDACSEDAAVKCVFCSIVLNAVADAKEKI